MNLTPAQTRRQRQRGEARRTILDATEALFIEAGGEDFSIRSLAERCGYTPPTIYHYFGHKEGLVAALLEERFARLLASVSQVEPGPDPLDNLRRMVANFLDFGRENPEFYRLIVARSRRGTDRTPPSAEQARAILERPWTDLEASGRLHASAQAAGQSLWALLHGLTALQVGRPDIEWAPDLVETAIEAMFRGLVRPAAGNGNGREH